MCARIKRVKPGSPIPGEDVVEPDVIRKSSLPYLTGSSLIGPQHLGWVNRMGFTDVISLERLNPDTIDGLESSGVNHHRFLVTDADEGPYMGVHERPRFVELVKDILKANQDARILVHCEEGRGRTPEALGIIEKELKG